jgi:hypothetical protein
MCAVCNTVCGTTAHAARGPRAAELSVLETCVILRPDLYGGPGVRWRVIITILLSLVAAAHAEDKSKLFVVDSFVIDPRTGAKARLLDARPKVCPAVPAYYLAAKDVVVRCGDGAQFRLRSSADALNSLILEPLDDRRTDDPGPSKAPAK